MQDNRNTSGQHDTLDVITPVDFSPPPPPGRRFTWRPRWYHGVIAVGLTVAASAGVFVLTARSVFIEVTPMTASVEVADGFAVQVGPRYLMRQGDYQLQFSAEGYYDRQVELSVGDEQAQTHPFELTPLPGLVSVSTRDALGQELNGARIMLDGVDLGMSPLIDAEVPPGTYELQVQRDRYLPYREQVEVEGRQIEQALAVTLAPAWADIGFASEPAGADIIINGDVLAVTPARIELLQGAYDVTIKRNGYKAWQDDIVVAAGVDRQLPAVSLEAADGLVFIRSTPGSANVTINGQYRGQTPLEVALPPGQEHDIRLFRTGFETAMRQLRTGAEESRELTVALDPITNPVRIVAEPADAQLYVEGELKGVANQTVNLIAASQRIEIRRDGYVPYATNFTSRPGLDQEIRVRLKTEEQARLESIEPVITSAAGQTLHLFYPYEFTMGSSRREPGRRANETLRDVALEKPFYLSLHPVTNQQFRRFRPEHASGTLQRQSLDRPNQPAVQVTWQDAALYSNWLSAQEALTPFYIVEEGAVTGFNADANGYRLPTEAEWEWAARADGQSGTTRFAWGEDWPPPADSGNFADESTSNFLGQILRGYNDGVQGTANVGEFNANAQGLFDMAGNVSEWVHDYYGAVSGLSSVRETDPLGPLDGTYHTIKGSGWAHGSITELRASYRDFGEEARNDLGFRIARYLGE
ncbi:PEGA domain-containing protein [Pseudohongiella sp.]|uniref:PEGA domain-containing protein n=1 Tax=marine sediment metagenome TaxID=412755 RepID=A0A0F9YAE5_9ZZZZ|nr:PEGA domain-containing protein [Pseudohongiella sp.]HDZ08036.1 PEGA domain-containing protein [Pseudohongiella sp.]HEA64121.1 PEGA domain-containing protein [Pseudohongiella sp.]